MAEPQSVMDYPGWRWWLRAPRTVLVLIMAAALLVGCAQGPAGTSTGPAQQAVMPGAGVQVTSARAESGGGPGSGGALDSGYFESEVVAALLGELGYKVSPPAAREMTPDVFYPAVAYRTVDYWANGWFPLHNAQLEIASWRRGVAGDLAGPVGDMVANGALLGYLIDKPTADKYHLTTMNDLTRPEIAALFDRDHNGKADLIGCQEGWECATYINDQIGVNGWRAEQVQGDYPRLFDDVAARVRAGQPVLYVTWTPSYMIAELVPGRDVTWLQAPNPPGTNTAVAGIAGCTGDPCETGFVPNSIRVVANNRFLSANPAARRLFELVTIDPQDIDRQNLLMRQGQNTQADIERQAQLWIQTNRAQVDRWLGEARAVAG